MTCLTAPLPEDSRPTRYYFALTNLCNRACELCSCHSDPSRGTHLPFDEFKRIVSNGARYEAQLEGGEPTIHPDFKRMVKYLVQDPLCERIILCTNAVKIPHNKTDGVLDEPRSVELMQGWLRQFVGKAFQLKPSINSHLIEREECHVAKMVALVKAFETFPWTHEAQLTFNVRRRPQPLSRDGDRDMISELKAAGLYGYCNDFEYQRYGKAQGEEALELPFVVTNPVKFYLFSPDGRDFGMDLVARADHMATLH